MQVLDLKGTQEFSPTQHIQKFLADSPRCSVSVACWEPGQVSPIHSHPGADEIYHVLEGEGLFRDGRSERRLGAGGTVLFPAGEAHQVQSLTRMVLYRVQAGADRHPAFFAAWPPVQSRGQ
jgi:quercetin dioxygenase-like cupin family protein